MKFYLWWWEGLSKSYQDSYKSKIKKIILMKLMDAPSGFIIFAKNSILSVWIYVNYIKNSNYLTGAAVIENNKPTSVWWMVFIKHEFFNNNGIRRYVLAHSDLPARNCCTNVRDLINNLVETLFSRCLQVRWSNKGFVGLFYVAMCLYWFNF